MEDDKKRRQKLWLMQVILAVPLTISLAIGLVACFVLTEVGVTLKGASFIIGLFTVAALSGYGIWRFDKEASVISRELRVRTGEVSMLWYLAPLSGIIGGIWAYRELRKTHEKLAKRLLLTSILVTIVLIIFRVYRALA